MKTLLKLVALAALAGCGRPSDIGPLQEEGNEVAQIMQPEVAALQHRWQAVEQKARSIPATAPDQQIAMQTIGQAKRTLDDLRVRIEGAPGKFGELAKKGQAEELRHEIDELREHLRDNATIASTYINTAEAWVSRSDAAARAQASNDAPPATSPGTEVPNPGVDSNTTGR